MTIYEIDKAITDLINNETGEISDYELFEQLQLDRETKIENIALAYKNYSAEAIMIKDEASRLLERSEKAKNAAERCKKLLEYALNGETFKSPKVAITYRKSVSVDLDENFVKWAQDNYHFNLLKFSEPTPNKTAIKEALNAGQAVEYARLSENTNIQVR